MLQHYLRAVANSLCQRGPLDTAKILTAVLYDRWRDRCERVDTAAWLSSAALGVAAASLVATRCYAPTPRLAFNRLLAQLAAAESGVWLDIGSGKGGVLLLAAASRRFQSVRGLEFSPVLNAIARRNLAQRQPPAPVELIEMDLRMFTLRGDETFVYLYDPFEAELIQQLLVLLHASLALAPRPLTLIYCNPRHEALFLASPLLHSCSYQKHWGFTFALYTLAAPAPAGHGYTRIAPQLCSATPRNRCSSSRVNALPSCDWERVTG